MISKLWIKHSISNGVTKESSGVVVIVIMEMDNYQTISDNITRLWNPDPWLRNKWLFSKLVTWTQHHSVDEMRLTTMPPNSVESTWIMTIGGFILESIWRCVNPTYKLSKAMKFFGCQLKLYNRRAHLYLSYDTRSHNHRVSFQNTYCSHAWGRVEG